MGLRSELYTYWKTKTTITSKFGSGDNCRIYPGVAPESATFPYAVHEIVSNDHEWHMTAASGLTKARLEIDVYDQDPVALEAAADAFRTTMDGLIQTTLTSIKVGGCHLQGERTELIVIEGRQGGVHVHQLDFSIWHNESVPTFPAT